jgi:hypothetical protein
MSDNMKRVATPTRTSHRQHGIDAVKHPVDPSHTLLSRLRRPALHRVVALGAVLGLSFAVAGPALAATSYVGPPISSTQSTFKVPVASTSTWTLRLWSHGTIVGSAAGKSGMLVVAVPHTSDCAFQADVTVSPVGGRSYFYSGNRAAMANCGKIPTQTITGHIYLCSTAGSPTTTEVAGGTLAATGPQTLAIQANPMAPTSVASGSYTMTAGAPTGFVLVSCGGNDSIGSTGQTASESATVPAGGAGVGVFYVTAPPSGAGGGSTGPTGPTGPSGVTSSSNSVKVPLAPAHAATAADHRRSVPTTPASASQLAFTGMNIGSPLLAALLFIVVGSLLIVDSRKRSVVRRTVPVVLHNPVTGKSMAASGRGAE